MVARAILRELTPPVLHRLLRRLRPARSGLVGRYASWEEAVRAGTGYDDALILERVTKAARQVERGEAAFDRDGVAFSEAEWPFPLIAALLRAASAGAGVLKVLDFGGGLGSSYRQCRPFLAHLPSVKWCVVEQPAFVRQGRTEFESTELLFRERIADCALSQPPDIVVFSSVLQYLEEPYWVLQEAKKTHSNLLFIDRTPCVERREDIITLQVVPEEIFAARLPFRAFSRVALEDSLTPEYRAVARFPAADADMWIRSERVTFGGWLFERVDLRKRDEL